MNIRFSDELLSDLRTLSGVLRLLFLLGLGIVLLFFLFFWDARCDAPFVETGPTEFAQTLFLALSTALFFLEARRSPDMREALVLTGGFIGCMLIREQDYFLDMLSHGCWKWPALALAFCCIAYAAMRPRATVAALARFVQRPHFPFLLVGMVVILIYSRLFGMNILWHALLPDEGSRAAKNAMEESSELLGYLFVLVSALMLRFGKRR